MAEDTARPRPANLWDAPWLAPVKSHLMRVPVAAYLGVAFLCLAFFVYYYTSAGSTAYNNFVFLADAFLDGRLDLEPDGRPFEWAVKDDKFYIIPPPMPAIIILPGVILFGTAISQALVSVVIGSLNASVVHGVIRGLRARLTEQVWLTALFVFGTIYWYVATNGGVWFFSQTVATLFLFLAIYATLIKKSPLLAGLFLGAAYLSRLPVVLSLPFFVIMFSEQWLPESRKGLFLRRIDPAPLLELGVGLGIFVLFNFAYNYVRFGSLIDGYYHVHPDIAAEPWRSHGPLHVSYMRFHFPFIFKNLPAFQSDPPFILAPAVVGMAIWATTPAFLYAFFADIKDRLVVAYALALFLIPVTLFALSARGMPLQDQLDLPYGLDYYPFAILVALAIIAALKNKNKLVLACWSAIIPIALVIFLNYATGWAQFGYRYALDFYPFLFLLTMKGMGAELRWHHKTLIVASILINLWAVLWIYQFEPGHFLDLTWATT